MPKLKIDKSKRDTLGKISSDLLQKDAPEIKIQEQQEAMQEDYMKNLLEAVDRGYLRYRKSFFIHVETKAEKLMPNVLRNYFIDRETCPTPNYDQTVFRYNNERGQVEFIWTIPCRDACHHLKANALQVADEEKELLGFVMMFDDGTLLKLCKRFNDEQENSTLLKKDDIKFSVSN